MIPGPHSESLGMRLLLTLTKAKSMLTKCLSLIIMGKPSGTSLIRMLGDNWTCTEV